jgi:hypothetical protein
LLDSRPGLGANTSFPIGELVRQLDQQQSFSNEGVVPVLSTAQCLVNLWQSMVTFEPQQWPLVSIRKGHCGGAVIEFELCLSASIRCREVVLKAASSEDKLLSDDVSGSSKAAFSKHAEVWTAQPCFQDYRQALLR